MFAAGRLPSLGLWRAHHGVGRWTRRERALLIPAVENALESLLRETLPLPEEVGEISFDAPSSTWAAQVNRVTVNLFLYGVVRSPLPPRPPQTRTGPDGGLERRPGLPLVQLTYLVSAWAGSVRDEHQLLGDVLTRLLAHQAIPEQHHPRLLDSSVPLALGSDEASRPRDLWGALGGHHRASFTLLVTVAAGACGWQATARGVSAIEGMAAPVPAQPAHPPGPPGPATRTWREGGKVHAGAVDEGA